MIVDIIIIFNKELGINCVPEIRNGCYVWEQGFEGYCVEPLVSSDAGRWGYRKANLLHDSAKWIKHPVILYLSF